MRPVRPSLQSAASTAASLLVFATSLLANAIASTSRRLWRRLRRVARQSRRLFERATSRANALSGPAKRFVSGPLRVVLFGRSATVSLLAVLAAPMLALAVAWWVDATVGYEALAASVRGTWFGTAPSRSVFLAAGALLVLAALSAAANSGVLPTTLLVSAAVFGAAVTRYGTTVTYTWGAEVVSLPNAVGTAVLLGLAFGVPIAAAGFLAGAFLRRVGATVRGRIGDDAESA